MLERNSYFFRLGYFKNPKIAVFLLFLLSYLTSFILFFPVDIFFLICVFFQRNHFIQYSFIATFGSTLGGLTGFYLGYFISDYLLDFLVYTLNFPSDFITIYSKYYAEYGNLIILFAAIFPFIPYRIISILAGVLKINIVYFIIISLLGRFIRFFTLGILVFYFYDYFHVILKIFKKYFKITEKMVKYFFISSVILSLIIYYLFYLIFK